MRFSESCLVILVNPQGCTVRCRRPLEIEIVVRFEGLPSGSGVTARVVNCISLGKHEEYWLVDLSLTEPGNVWGVPTPPEDCDIK